MGGGKSPYTFLLHPHPMPVFRIPYPSPQIQGPGLTPNILVEYPRGNWGRVLWGVEIFRKVGGQNAVRKFWISLIIVTSLKWHTICIQSQSCPAKCEQVVSSHTLLITDRQARMGVSKRLVSTLFSSLSLSTSNSALRSSSCTSERS